MKVEFYKSDKGQELCRATDNAGRTFYYEVREDCALKPLQSGTLEIAIGIKDQDGKLLYSSMHDKELVNIEDTGEYGKALGDLVAMAVKELTEQVTENRGTK